MDLRVLLLKDFADKMSRIRENVLNGLPLLFAASWYYKQSIVIMENKIFELYIVFHLKFIFSLLI